MYKQAILRCQQKLMVIFFLCAVACLSASAGFGQETSAPKELPAVTKQQAISIGVERLIEIQHDDGAWPYEGVYRVRGKIPVGYRIGGTAICCEALLYATDNDNAKATAAIESGIKLILRELENPLMEASTANRYDVRVWGHVYALDLFCRLKTSGRFENLEGEFGPWIPKLTKMLLSEELDSGGWNYASRNSHAGFVTASALQALLWARQLGQDVPTEVLQRTSDALFRSRNSQAAFAYSGDDRKRRPEKLPGSIARAANCELTLQLLGHPRQNAIQYALSAFHEHWDELEKRRKKTGTHIPPYGIAPYYFYYGHRYAAQAVQGLPKDARAAEYERLFEVLMRTRDPDGTWNDRIFAQSRAYGTAMSVLSLLEDKAPAAHGLSPQQIDGENEIGERDPVITINAEDVPPELVVDLVANDKIGMLEKEFSISEFTQWLPNYMPPQKPSIILIRVDNSVNTKVVEQVKNELKAQLGECTMLIEVNEKKSD